MRMTEERLAYVEGRAEEQVRMFVTLKDAIANPTEAGAIMHKHHRQVDEGVARDETMKVGQLATVAGAPLGAIEEGRLQRTIDVIAGAYTLKSSVKAADIYAPGFVPK